MLILHGLQHIPFLLSKEKLLFYCYALETQSETTVYPYSCFPGNLHAVSKLPGVSGLVCQAPDSAGAAVRVTLVQMLK